MVLASTEYVRMMPRFQGEYFGLLLFSATGMMLLAAATELITIYVALELTTLPLAALAAFLMNGRSSEAGVKFSDYRGHQFGAAALRHGAGVRLHRQHSTHGNRCRRRTRGRGRRLRQLRAAGGHRAAGSRVRLQDFRRSLPDVGARRLRGSADARGRLPVGGQQGRRFRRSVPGAVHRLLPTFRWTGRC